MPHSSSSVPAAAAAAAAAAVAAAAAPSPASPQMLWDLVRGGLFCFVICIFEIRIRFIP